jgi:bifunctional non-homologous end joining protein LigD
MDIRIDDHEIRITRANKVLFPKDGITKSELIDYYRRIAPWMVPHLKDRPLAVQRFPDGIGEPGFFQKAAGPYYPAWIRKVTVPKAGGTVKHVVCDDAATLVYLANQASVTLHTWLSCADDINFPDQMIFDLDPPGTTSSAVIQGAHLLREILDELELPVYLKATGGRGLHIAVPLERKQDFDTVRALARSIGGLLVNRDPSRYTMEQYQAKRGGRVFVDTNRNGYAQTAVSAYSVRARDGAPIAIPLDWSALRKKGFRPDSITIRNVFDHVDKAHNPWHDFHRRAVSLDGARQRLEHVHAA